MGSCRVIGAIINIAMPFIHGFMGCAMLGLLDSLRNVFNSSAKQKSLKVLNLTEQSITELDGEAAKSLVDGSETTSLAYAS
jgi:hypothetical protein